VYVFVVPRTPLPEGSACDPFFFGDHAEVVPFSNLRTAMIKPLVGCMTGLKTHWSGAMVARIGLIVVTRKAHSNVLETHAAGGGP